MEANGISRATMGRLPSYLNYLNTLPRSVCNISATSIAKDLGLGEVQVRKDLSRICGEGKPRVGYLVSTLRTSLERALGTHTECEAVIVGAGKLGMALLSFDGFAEYGIVVSQAFDINVAVDGATGGVAYRNPADSEHRRRLVSPLDSLPAYCALHQIEIGIIAVPAEAAQSTSDLLVKSGVRAIMTFANVRLKVPDGVIVQYENMALSLAHLHQRVRQLS